MDSSPSLLASGFRILAKPRVTMRALIDANTRAGYRMLPALSGLITAPSAALSVAAAVHGYDLWIWLGAVILSVLGFWMYVYVYGYAYRLIGRWFDAGGTNGSSRLALAWTQVPFILLCCVVIPLQIVYRDDFFPEFDLLAVMGGSVDELNALLETERSIGFTITNLILYTGGLIAWVWSLFVLGEALECPAWKAFLIKMTAVLLHIPIFIVAAIPAFILALLIVIFLGLV